MPQLWLYALGAPLPGEFKLASAPVPKKNDNVLAFLSKEPKLLTASFEINNKHYTAH